MINLTQIKINSNKMVLKTYDINTFYIFNISIY